MRQRQNRIDRKRNDFYINVGVDSFILIGLFTFASFMPTVMDITSKLSLIGISQILMLVIGLSAGYFINRDVIVSGFPDDDLTIRSVNTLIAGFIILKIMSMIVTPFASTFESSLEIVMMASVAEESFFGLFLTTMFYKIFRYISSSEIVTQIISLSTVGLFFAIMHVGVYGFNISILIFLFLSRIVLSYTLLRSKNFSVPILVHFIYNTLAMF